MIVEKLKPSVSLVPWGPLYKERPDVRLTNLVRVAAALAVVVVALADPVAVSAVAAVKGDLAVVVRVVSVAEVKEVLEAVVKEVLVVVAALVAVADLAVAIKLLMFVCLV